MDQANAGKVKERGRRMMSGAVSMSWRELRGACDVM
jgi:hypothetical protein